MSPLRLTAMMMSAPSARQVDTGTGLTSPPSASQRTVGPDRTEDAGKRDGRPYRLEDRTVAQPDLPAGFEVGGDGGVRLPITLDRRVDAESVQHGDDALAIDDAAGGQAHIEEADHLPPRDAEREASQRRQPIRDVGGADERPD